MYTLFIVLIIIVSACLIFAVLAQSPKSGMAANFGASNQVMGVRQTADILEKFTWWAAIAIVVLSLLATIFVSSHTKSSAPQSDSVLEQIIGEEEIEGLIPNQIEVVEETTSENPE